MFSFLQRKQQQEQTDRQAAIADYARLVDAMSKAGDLSDADGAKLERCAKAMNLPLLGEAPSVADHVELVSRQRELDPIVGDIESRSVQADNAAVKVTEFQAETDALVKALILKRQGKLDQLVAEAEAARQKWNDAERARPELQLVRAKLADYAKIIDGELTPENAASGWASIEQRISHRAIQLGAMTHNPDPRFAALSDVASSVEFARRRVQEVH